ELPSPRDWQGDRADFAQAVTELLFMRTGRENTDELVKAWSSALSVGLLEENPCARSDLKGRATQLRHARKIFERLGQHALAGRARLAELDVDAESEAAAEP